MNDDFVLRSYQVEVLEQAKLDNVIAFLPTGTGKTLIACHLIDFVRRLEPVPGEGRRAIAFVAPTKVLVEQQMQYIHKNCFGNIAVKTFNGECRHHGQLIERWTADVWHYYLDNFEVFAMVPEILKNLLMNKFLLVSDFKFFIFDECHEISGNSPMARVCDIIRDQTVADMAANAGMENPPRSAKIFGMTASPIVNKCSTEDIQKKKQEIEKKLMCRLLTPEQLVFRRPAFYVAEYYQRHRIAFIGTGLTPHCSPARCTMNVSCLRLRLCNQLHDIYKYLNTLQITPAEVPSLSILDMPDQFISPNVVLLVIGPILNQLQDISLECGIYCGLQGMLDLLSTCYDFLIRKIRTALTRV